MEKEEPARPRRVGANTELVQWLFSRINNMEGKMSGGMDVFRTEIRDKMKEGFVGMRDGIREDVSRLLGLFFDPQNRLTPESNGPAPYGAGGGGGDPNSPHPSDAESDFSRGRTRRSPRHDNANRPFDSRGHGYPPQPPNPPPNAA